MDVTSSDALSVGFVPRKVARAFVLAEQPYEILRKTRLTDASKPATRNCKASRQRHPSANHQPTNDEAA
eukprot:scaffold32644_cov55-Attheya_sp.AAC.4